MDTIEAYTLWTGSIYMTATTCSEEGGTNWTFGTGDICYVGWVIPAMKSH